MAEKYVLLNKQAKNLYERFLPGPITVVSNGKHTVAAGVEAENGTLGIRIPNYPFFLQAFLASENFFRLFGFYTLGVDLIF